MASYSKDNPDTNIQITNTENVEHYTDYVIEVRISGCCWTVKHRYNEFFELNEQLVNEYGFDKKHLPPKKVFGNTSETFIQKRRAGLEKYLQTLLKEFDKIPFPLAMFLDFQKYEINGVTQVLAETLFTRGEMLLDKDSTCSMDPLQLYAISKRLLKPETVDVSSSKRDLGHILDFVTRLQKLRIIGTDKTIGSSDINMNKLEFSLTMFKNLKYLELCKCDVTRIQGLSRIRGTLEKLKIKRSLQHIQDFLSHDLTYWDDGGQETVAGDCCWPALKWVDLSENNISEVHESIRYLERMEFLDLHDNYLQEIEYLEMLSYVSHLDLSNNRIKTLPDLQLKLGNVKSINLSGNKLETLLGFAKLYSLEYLDVSNNQISQVVELTYVESLPLLTTLVIAGNPVTIIPDYRVQILKLFGDRAKEITLDNLKPTEKELDTIAVLLALDHAKQPINKPPMRPKGLAGAEAPSSNDPPFSGLDELVVDRSKPTTSSEQQQPVVTEPKPQTPSQPRRFDSPFNSPTRSTASDGSFHSVNSQSNLSGTCESEPRNCPQPAVESASSSPCVAHSISDSDEDACTTRPDGAAVINDSLVTNESSAGAMTDHINSGNGDKKNDELISATNPSLSVHLVDEMEKCLQECPSYIQNCKQLQRYQQMDGEALLNLFYTDSELCRVGDDKEELCHALWTQIISRGVVKDSCCLVLLSNQATYFIKSGSGEYPEVSHLTHPSLDGIQEGPSKQCFSLSAGSETICCLTRNPKLTDLFLFRLTLILQSDFPDKKFYNEEEESIYDQFSETQMDSYVRPFDSADISHFLLLQGQTGVVDEIYLVIWHSSDGAKPMTMVASQGTTNLIGENYVYRQGDVSCQFAIEQVLKSPIVTNDSGLRLSLSEGDASVDIEFFNEDVKSKFVSCFF